jgi:Flp pilus assembly protein TadG
VKFPLALIWLNRSGAAAAEMALVTPLLATLMFGSLEVGKFFWDEHIVLKSVRDGARFASRQSFANMPCDGTATNEEQIQNVVRFGKPVVTGSDQSRLHYWTDNSTITVSITCYDNSGTDGDRVFDGIYSARAEVPVVNVRATVPYSPIAASLGFGTAGLDLNAQSEVTVFGI